MVAAGALLACLLAPSAADAAWLEATQVSDAGSTASQPQIAVDEAGDAVAVWTAGSGPNRVIRSAAHPAGGTWESPSVAVISGHDCHDPRLAMDHMGRAVAIAGCETPSPSIWAAYREEGHWNPAGQVVGSSGGTGARGAIDAEGNAVAVWSAGTVIHSAYRARLGTWILDSGQLSTSGKQAFEPNVAMSPDGYAFAVWREKREESGGDPVINVLLSRRHGSGAWSAPGALTPNFGSGSTTPVASGEPQIAANSQGGRMVAWGLAETTMEERTSTSDLGGYAEPATHLSEATASIEATKVAVDDQTLGIATWRSYESGTFTVMAATTGFSNGPWSSPTNLSGPTGNVGTEPVVSANGDGDAIIAFQIGATVSATYRAAGSGLTAATPISASPHGGAFLTPATAIDRGGNALVAWTSASAAPSHIALAVDDVTPPTLSDLGAPQSVEVGEAATLNVTATDTWSPVTVTWDFGDGSTGTGTATSHTYGAAGTKTVKVTATDAAGNSASLTRQVSVTPKGSGNRRGPVVLTVKLPKQSWKQIAKTMAVKLRCKLDADGTCSVTTSLTAGAARRLGLKVAKKAKTATIGKGSAQVRSGQFGTVKVKLTGKARKAIGAASRSVPVNLAVTGSAPGRESAAKRLTLKIKRP